MIPESNPEANPDAISLSGIRYSDVLDGIHRLYPPEDLDSRNAISRTDGYWPYLKDGKDPPKEFTYGEYDLYFFAELLDRAWVHYTNFNGFESDNHNDKDGKIWNEKVFLDIGSGAGRLVVAAAALHPNWKECRGIEILSCLHKIAEEISKNCDGEGGTSLYTGKSRVSLSPISFTRGSFLDPYDFPAHDVDLIFVFSSCMSRDMIDGLGVAIGRQCKPGTIVITTDYLLPLQGDVAVDLKDENLPSGPFRISLVEKLDGYSWITGGESTAYIHRVEESLWSDGKRFERPVVTAEDMCYEVAMLRESGQLTDSEAFLRKVANQMIWNNLPSTWIPKRFR